MAKKVPLVIYGPEGERKVIGTAELDDKHVFAFVDDPEIVAQLTEIDYEAFSIVPEEDATSPTHIRKNVFDKDSNER